MRRELGREIVEKCAFRPLHSAFGRHCTTNEIGIGRDDLSIISSMAKAEGMLIRKAETRDLQDLLGVLAQLGQTTPLSSASENVQNVWQQIQSQPYRALLVAEVFGRVVGTVDWYL